MDHCVICQKSDDQPLICLREKGSNGINDASRKREDTPLTIVGQYVHIKCRESYVNPFNIAKVKINLNKDGPLETPNTPNLRSQEQFDFKTHCLFCGQIARKDRKRTCEVYQVRTDEFQTKILDICKLRGDIWGTEVLGKIKSVNDLHAADAIYHQTCSSNFRTMKAIPSCFSNDLDRASKRGRPYNKEDHFEEILEYLNAHQDEQVSVNQLVERMKETCGDEAFTSFHMKQRLLKHYKDDIIIVEKYGTGGIVTLRDTAKSILNDFFLRPLDKDSEEEKNRIILTAAKLIKSDIRSVPVDREYYPSTGTLSSGQKNLDFVPKGLQHFLRELIPESQLKMTSIGQAIMQASRPRSLIAPLQLGLAVQLHHNFGSRFLLDELNHLGFCSSYAEVQKFESSAAISQGLLKIPGYEETDCLQFVADNVDHNIGTLDGKETFHGMGIVAGITPMKETAEERIRRTETSTEELLAGKINIKYYRTQ